MKYVLVETEANWADEFDVHGAAIYDREKAEERLAQIKKWFEEGELDETSEFYFGTNEAFQFSDYEDFKSSVTLHDVDEGFANQFKVIFPYGLGEDILSMVYDNTRDDIEWRKREGKGYGS